MHVHATRRRSVARAVRGRRRVHRVAVAGVNGGATSAVYRPRAVREVTPHALAAATAGPAPP